MTTTTSTAASALTAPTGVPSTIWRTDPLDTKAVQSMEYPATAADGSVFDLAIAARGIPDPYMTVCPSWCDAAGEGHAHVESQDEDRNHFGERFVIPVRSIPAEYQWGKDGSTYLLGHASLYLRQNASVTSPSIWLGKGESDEHFDLTVDEAEALGTVLLALAKAGR